MYDANGNPVPNQNEGAYSNQNTTYYEPQSAGWEETPYRSAGSSTQNNTYQYSYRSPYSDGVTAKPKQKKAHRERKSGLTAGKVIALILVCAIIGGLAGVGGAAIYGKKSVPDALPDAGTSTAVPPAVSGSSTVFEGERPSSALSISKIDTSKEMTVAEVYAANVNSTVGIRTSITVNYWGYQSQAAASGSGFILTDDGYILTNYHVVEDSNSISVTTYDNTVYNAELIGYDESNDIAVLKIDASGLVPVVLGDSSQLNVGDTVAAIGNPLGELTFSLTSGVVSALEREVTLSSTVTMKLIQTDCAINSGNSGGALFNTYGEVVGITNAKYSTNNSNSSQASIDNIGFAIPINSVRSIVSSIIENGYIVKPYIGVIVSTVSADAQTYGLPAGASVRSVTADGPSEKAGLQENDIITAVDGKAITSSSDLVSTISAYAPGTEITLTVYRNNEELTIKLTVGETKQSAKANEDAAAESQQQNQNSQQNQQGQPNQQLPQGQQGQSGQQNPQQDNGQNSQGNQFNWEDFFNQFGNIFGYGGRY